MEIIFGLIAVLIVAALAIEYRIKKPGQIILYESNGSVKLRKSSFYPVHFSLIIPNTTYTLNSVVESEAKGKIGLLIKYTATITPALQHISKLVRIGGWGKEILNEAAKELDIILQGKVKGFTEKFDAEEIKSEAISNFLREETMGIDSRLGLEILSLTIQSVEPTDKKISEAIRQKELSRILEETEKNNQRVRIQTAQLKLKADEEIMRYEHELEINRLKLKEIEEEREAALALKKIGEQVKRDKIRLELEKEEMSMFKENPELLLLTPQVARLAEASQNLKNARTVISLGDFENGSQLAEALKNFLGGLLNALQEKKN